MFEVACTNHSLFLMCRGNSENLGQIAFDFPLENAEMKATRELGRRIPCVPNWGALHKFFSAMARTKWP